MIGLYYSSHGNFPTVQNSCSSSKRRPRLSEVVPLCGCRRWVGRYHVHFPAEASRRCISAMHGQPTRHADRLSRNESGIVAEKECDHARIVIRPTKSTHWNRPASPSAILPPSGELLRKPSNSGVSVGPGQTTFKMTFFCASSRASVLVNEIKPPLHASRGRNSCQPGIWCRVTIHSRELQSPRSG